MQKIIVGLLVTALLMLSAMPVSAAQSSKSSKLVNPNVLEAVFIHYDHPAKPVKPGTQPPPPDNEYFETIGPAWNLIGYPAGIPFVINPSRAPLGAQLEVIKAFETWDGFTGQKLFDTPEIDYSSWWGSRDGRNNISWQNLAGGTIIAATWIWYEDNDGSGTMTPGDETIENDIVFNASMRWGIDGDGEGTDYSLKNMYDVCNIATHEVGHVVGLDDLYDQAYREITMYGYGAKTETRKISLQAGDISGTRALYP